MDLLLDVGNTRLKWALYASPQPGAAVLAHGAAFLETIDELAEGDWKRLAPPLSVLGCNVAGEAVRRRVEEQLEERQRKAAEKLDEIRRSMRHDSGDES